MSDRQLIGQTAPVNLPELGYQAIPARIDTGAKTSAIWASGIIERGGSLQCVLFSPSSPLYDGKVLHFEQYSLRTILSSIGISEERYVVKLLVVVNGRKIKASFTLANRAHQEYPMLVGRNILRGKFIVDVDADPMATAKPAANRVRKVPLKTHGDK